MANHPIEALMKTAMESIQQMVDVNTVVGDPVETPDGQIIIPVSRVCCGFAAGGSEFAQPGENQNNSTNDQGNNNNPGKSFPFGGGSGAGVSVQPVGFLVVGQGQVRLLPIDGNVIVERIIDEVPGLIDKLSGAMKKNKEEKKDDEKVIVIADE